MLSLINVISAHSKRFRLLDPCCTLLEVQKLRLNVICLFIRLKKHLYYSTTVRAHFQVVERPRPGTKLRGTRTRFGAYLPRHGEKKSVLSKIVLTLVYCSVALYQNHHNRPERSYFRFSTDKQLAVWLKFCHRADSLYPFKLLNNLRFSTEYSGYSSFPT